MWVITGPFDGQEKGEVEFKKAKLLKTGSRYSLGRKERQLIVNHAKVSHDHAAFSVSPYSPEDVTEPSVIPQLSLHNVGKKPMTINRGDGSLTLNPSSTEVLQQGDVINIVVGVSLVVRWISVCCLASVNRGKSTVSLDACASLGINIVFNSHPNITHHLVTHYAVNPVIATSLLSAAQFVKPEWLNEIVRLGSLPVGNDPSNGNSLEQVFALPAETKFRPTFAAALPVALKIFKVWEPNEERINMFRGYRFLFVGEKGREVDEMMTEFVRRGGGEREVFSVDGGRQKLHRILAKGKAKLANISEHRKGLVLVADAHAITTAVGSEQWEALVDEAKDFDLKFVSPDDVLQAVLHVDMTYVTPTHMDEPCSSSPLPDFVPNTHPEELSYFPLTHPTGNSSNHLEAQVKPSVVSRPSTPPPEPDDNEGVPPPRKLLKRRAKVPPPSIIGVDDPSIIDAVSDIVSATASATSYEAKKSSGLDDVTASIPPRSSRLKRRAGTVTSSLANTQTLFNENMGDIGKEPPLKKFKALFDASHPDQNSVPDFGDGGSSYSPGTFESQSMTQSGPDLPITSGGRMDVEPATLAAVVEEEEEVNGVNRTTRNQQAKRKLSGDNDIDMTTVESEAGSGATTSDPGPAAKRRAIENVNAVKSSHGTVDEATNTRSEPSAVVVTKPAATSGAAASKPDMDVTFLKAIASTKRGKKAEDSFDREFNKLKISKPDIRHDDQEREWAVLDDLEERNIRGNFMVVLEMDICLKGQERGNSVMKLKWQERPNFKKFKKRLATSSRPKVELVVNEENDYGMGPVYWKHSAQSQSQGSAPLSQSQISKLPYARTHPTCQVKGRTLAVTDSDEDLDHPVPQKGKAVPAQTTRNQAGTSRIPHTQPQPLFLDSDEHDGFHALDDSRADNDNEMTLQPIELKTQEAFGRSLKPVSTKRNKKAPMVVDDDSDDGATFKGFRGKKKGAR